MEAKEKPGAGETYRERAERRRQTRGTGEARGVGWQRTPEDGHLLRLATRYSTLTLHQTAYACWGGRIEAARRRVRLMTEAGLLLRRLGRPVGADGSVAAEAVPGRPAKLLEALGVPRVPGVPTDACHGETLAVPASAHAVHWSDLVVVEPTPRFRIAVEVELTAKSPAAIRTILRAYQQAQRRVLYLATEPVIRQLQGSRVRMGGGPMAWPKSSDCSRRASPPRPGVGRQFSVRPFTASRPRLGPLAPLLPLWYLRASTSLDLHIVAITGSQLDTKR
ncbi:hypothetical protein ABZ829_35850 [Streptomyces xanthochromogenes]|uniref:hypothetical protein n=1 Tax=Streptomyces xanthochromogenes TaxID=67384 RepID=UPI00343E8F0E